MGLKGYRLWVMGQLDSTCRAPPQVQGLVAGGVRVDHVLPLGRQRGV
jgi:hypothetical protein